MIFTILIFLIVLSLLVFVHELGHFVVAKRSGMKVHEFGFGFPPRILGIQKIDGKWKVVWGNKDAHTDSTVYSINAIPLGGFVKIMGEDAEEEGDARSFVNKPFLPRFFTLAAGVIMNIILAIVLLSVGYMAGLPVAVQDLNQIPGGAKFTEKKIAIVEVKDGSVAKEAGFEAGDIVLSVNTMPLESIAAFQGFVAEHKGEKIEFEIQRVNEVKHLSVQTRLDADPSKGVLGVGLAIYGKLKFGPAQAVVQGAQTAITQFGAIAKGLYGLFSSGAGLESLGGPVKIAQLTGQVADLGIIPLLQFAAFLSLNLALLNALPFPALDGGRILFLIIEKIRGKRNNAKVEQYANAIGFLTLLLLMLVISVRDVAHLEAVKNLFS